MAAAKKTAAKPKEPKLLQNWKNAQDVQKQEELQYQLNLKEAEGSARADLIEAEKSLLEHQKKLSVFERKVYDCETAIGANYSSARLLNARMDLKDAKEELALYEQAVIDLKAINKEMLGI